MTKLTTSILIILGLALFGCDREDTIVVQEVVDDDPAPATPQGVFSVTGDSTVYLFFNGIYEHDVDFYAVYRSLEATTGYTEIGSVNAVSNPDLDLLIYEYQDHTVVNRYTYWYAVTAIDHAGQESDLSAEDVFDTPRPAGIGDMAPYDMSIADAGFNLAAGQRVNADLPLADIYLDRIVDTVVVVFDTTFVVYPYLNVGNIDTDIQDLGYTEDFDEISYAPADGWSQLGYVEALLGHTYVVWTNDLHYAKIRITSITSSGAISFQWGYQTDQNNLELAPPVRPLHDDNYPAAKSTVVTQLIK